MHTIPYTILLLHMQKNHILPITSRTLFGIPYYVLHVHVLKPQPKTQIHSTKLMSLEELAAST